MDLESLSQGLGVLRKFPGLFRVEDGLGQIMVKKKPGFCRRGIAQHQNRDLKTGLAKSDPLCCPGDSNQVGPVVQGGFRRLKGAVAAGVGLDHSHKPGLLGNDPFHLPAVVGNGLQVDLRPDRMVMFVSKRHAFSLFFVV